MHYWDKETRSQLVQHSRSLIMITPLSNLPKFQCLLSMLLPLLQLESSMVGVQIRIWGLDSREYLTALSPPLLLDLMTNQNLSYLILKQAMITPSSIWRRNLLTLTRLGRGPTRLDSMRSKSTLSTEVELLKNNCWSVADSHLFQDWIIFRLIKFAAAPRPRFSNSASNWFPWQVVQLASSLYRELGLTTSLYMNYFPTKAFKREAICTFSRPLRPKTGLSCWTIDSTVTIPTRRMEVALLSSMRGIRPVDLMR